MNRPLGEYLTLAQAAERLGLRPDTVGKYAKRGLIQVERPGWQPLVHPDEVARYSRERRGPGRPPQNPPQPVG